MTQKTCLLKKKKIHILFFPTFPHEWSREFEIFFFFRLLAKPQNLSNTAFTRMPRALFFPFNSVYNLCYKYLYREIIKFSQQFGDDGITKLNSLYRCSCRVRSGEKRYRGGKPHSSSSLNLPGGFPSPRTMSAEGAAESQTTTGRCRRPELNPCFSVTDASQGSRTKCRYGAERDSRGGSKVPHFLLCSTPNSRWTHGLPPPREYNPRLPRTAPPLLTRLCYCDL